MSHRARKRFGQNFLHDPAIIDRIIDSIYPQANDHIVEIGPGQAALTQGLIAKAGKVTAIEIDRDLAAFLRNKFAGVENFELIEGDALKINYGDFADGQRQLRLVGNLPYNLSTPLLFRFLESADQVKDMTLMLQKEVVDRIVAEPGNKTWGRLGVMLQAICDTERLMNIGPGAFKPAPRVDSAIVRLRPFTEPPVQITDQTMFAALVKQAFSQRRKTLRQALKKMLSSEEFDKAEVDSGRRAETLSVQEFAGLANALAERETRSAE